MLQAVKKRYTTAVKYQTYRLMDCSTDCDDTVSSHIADEVNKIRSQLKAFFFEPKVSISFEKFSFTIRLACNSNKLHAGAAMWVLAHYVQESHVNALNSCICVKNRFAPLSPTAQNEQHRSRELLRSYQVMVNYLLEKYTSGPLIA